MYGRDLRRRSLAADTTRSRQVFPNDGGGRTAILERSGPDLPPPPLRPAKVQFDDGLSDPPSDAPPGTSTDHVQSAERVPWLRRPGGQVFAVLVLVLGVWLVVIAGDGDVTRSELGSDVGGLSPERAALVRLIDGVLGRVETGSGDGDQGAEFGAGGGPDGRPPAAPGSIGRDRPGSGGPGPSAQPDSSTVDQDADGQLRQAGGQDESDLADGSTSTLPPSSTVSSSQPTSSTITEPTITTVRPTSTATTAAPTTTTTTTAAPTTATTAAPTTTANPGCVVVISTTMTLWADPRGRPTEVGQVGPGTYSVAERFGAKWYRIAGGWVRESGGLTPQSC